MSIAGELLLTALNIATAPDRLRTKWRNDKRRQRARKAKPKPPEGCKYPKPPPKPIPNDDNQPIETSQCPKCADKSDGFKWEVRERVWRCARCRRPLKFVNGVAELNFFRKQGAKTAPSGWRIPDSVEKVRSAGIAIGMMLLNEPKPVTTVRKQLASEGHKKHHVNEAIRALRIREFRPNKNKPGPAPVFFELPHERMRQVIEWTGELLVEALEGYLATRPVDVVKRRTIARAKTSPEKPVGRP